jgi:membrane associated rhomboid family serine protease
MKEFFGEINRMLDRFLTPAVKTILVINVLVTLALMFLGLSQGLQIRVIYLFGQVPALSILHLWAWQWVTYAFVHVEFMHLLFNMVTLWFFGPPLENRWGTRRFWRFYLIVAAGAGLFDAVFTLLLRMGDPSVPVIGASGALFGVMLAYAAYYPDQPVYVWGVLPIKIKHLMVLLMIANLMMAGTTGQAMGNNISFLTHTTGLGVAYVWLALYHHDWDIRHWRWTRAA